MNFPELMVRMGDDDDDADSLTDVQIIGRLKSIHELRGEKHDFKPGMIVRHKYPNLRKNSRTANAPGLFIRYLDSPIAPADHPEAFDDIANWASHIAALQYDCVVGFVLGPDFVEFFENTTDWRPATNDDYGPVVDA